MARLVARVFLPKNPTRECLVGIIEEAATEGFHIRLDGDDFSVIGPSIGVETLLEGHVQPLQFCLTCVSGYCFIDELY